MKIIIPKSQLFEVVIQVGGSKRPADQTDYLKTAVGWEMTKVDYG